MPHPEGPCVALDLGSSRIRAALSECSAMVDRPSAIPPSSAIRYGLVADPAACTHLVRQALYETNQLAPYRPGTDLREAHPRETNPRAAHPGDTNPREANPRETNPRETNPRAAHPGDTNPRGANPRETNPRETNPRAAHPGDTNPREANPGDTNRREANPRETNPRGAHPGETNLREAHPWPPVREVVLAVPVAATSRDRRRAVAAVRAAAGCPVRTIEAPVAAAIVAGLPLRGPHPCLLMDIGAGIIEAALIMDGEVVHARSIQYAPLATQAEPPRYVTERLATELRELLGELPPRLRVRARGHGLLLTGGGALLPHLPGSLTAGTGLTVTVAHDPARATIRGLTRL